MANIPLRRGMLIRHQNHIYEVVHFQEHHAGKQKPTVHVALRDVRDGRPVDRNLDDIMPLDPVDHAYRKTQYLYARGATLVFMDSESFEEIELAADRLGNQAAFLVEGGEYRGTFIDGAFTTVEIPDIAARLQAEGIDVSRRTIAKYRQQLHIPAARQRREF